MGLARRAIPTFMTMPLRGGRVLLHRARRRSAADARVAGPVDPAPDLDQIELPHPVFPPPARLALQFVSSVPTVAPLDGAYRLRVTAVPTVGLPTTLEMPVGAITSTPGGLFLPLGMRAISFHDGRGLIVDPIYVAALFADLQMFLPGLTMNNPAAPINGAGEVQPILGLISGTLVHCLDPHGGVYRPALPAATLVTKSAVAVMGTVPATGLVTLASSGDGIDTAGTDNGRLRWVSCRTGCSAPAASSRRRPPRRWVGNSIRSPSSMRCGPCSATAPTRPCSASPATTRRSRRVSSSRSATTSSSTT